MADTNGSANMEAQEAQLLMFAAAEVGRTFDRIVHSLRTYMHTGELPEVSSVPGAADARIKKPREKGKRKPTAFNHFVKEKLQELRTHTEEDGPHSNNDLFALAVAEWGKLSAEEKSAYTTHFKEEEAEHEAAGQVGADADDAPEDADGDEHEDEDPAVIEAAPPAAAGPAGPETDSKKENKRKRKDGAQSGEGDGVATAEKKKKKKKKAADAALA